MRNAQPLPRVCVFTMLVPLLALAPTAYRILDLGVPPGMEEVYASAINNRGEVLVSTPVREKGKDAKGGRTFQSGHGYLWRAGRFLDFGDPKPSQGFDPPSTNPMGLNDLSVAVGSEGDGRAVFMTGLSDVNPFIWRGKGMEDLGTGWASIPMAINDRGDVVGDAQHRGFARIGGKTLPIGTLSHVTAGNRSDARAINANRLILGDSTYGGTPGKSEYDLPTRPFTIDGNRLPLRMAPVPLPRGFRSARGLALNDGGTILAVASGTEAGAVDTPYLVRKGKIVRLPMPRDFDAVAQASLNERGDVIATLRTHAYTERSLPTLWLGGKRITFPHFTGWTLQTAVGINNRGTICGTGLHEGKTRAYVLTPFRGFGGRR